MASKDKLTPVKSKKSASTVGYKAEDITVLEGLEAVRRRPGMYIGTTGTDGLYHLIWEIFDNARDEAMAGYADEIEIVLLPEDKIRVADNGRGIPVDIHQKTKVSALETIMTTLHAGGKFGDSGYKVSGGLHGVGVSVVNALSTEVTATVHRDEKIYQQTYTLGKPTGKVKTIGKSYVNGTVVVFLPDEKIFTTTKFNGEAFDIEPIVNRIRDQAYLVKSLHIRIVDARHVEKTLFPEDALFIYDALPMAPTYSFYYDSGLVSFVHHHNRRQQPVHQNVFYIDKEMGEVKVEIALQYVDDISSRIFGFGNTIHNPEGGTHIKGFKTALTKTINSYAKTRKLKVDAFTGDDVLEGLTAVVSVQLPEIQFEGQTKAKLGSVEARSAVDTVFSSAFSSFLEENPNDAKNILSKITLAYQARKAAKIAKDSVLRKGALEGMTLPGKLADCQSRNASESELFIVEGESAGGTAKQGRDRRTQAILPLRGKILNVERVRIDRVMSSEEIKTLIIALGTGIGESFDISKLRYGKVIIATDADVDGAHIRTLLLTLFYRYFEDLINAGHIYFAQPPLYKVKKGKDVQYAFSDKERDAFIKKMSSKKSTDASDKTNDSGVFIQRYKGLGEMNYEELRDTTMNKENRILKQVTIQNAKQADEVFDMLMGNEVPPRKKFIQENAINATLDI